MHPRIVNGVLLVSLGTVAMGQVTLTPRRVGRAFSGTIPFLAEVEAQGPLKALRVRVIDPEGKSAPGAWQEAFTLAASGQAWAMLSVSDLVGRRPTGVVTLEWMVVSEQRGQLRTERTETRLRLVDPQEGWMETLGGSDDLGTKLQLAATWTPGQSLRLSIDPSLPLRRLRYQVVSPSDETVVTAWQELPLREGRRTWSLPAAKLQKEGPLQLWVLAEEGSGRAHWVCRDVYYGRPSRLVAGLPHGGDPSGSRLTRRISGPATTALATHLAPAGGNADWLQPLDPFPSYGWGETNRVATASASYRDQERNDPNAWPSSVGNPMVLNLSAATGLGKPLYSLSYLLLPGTNLEGAATQALQVSATSANLPKGAPSLRVGGVGAPVVVSAGTLDDFLGKPLAAGYGWALPLTNQPGTVTDAYTWTNAATAAPATGLNAISAATDLRYQLQQTAIADVGYAGTEAALDSTRAPYALTFSSQDPLTRPILSKGLGAKQNSALGVYVPAPKIRSANFDDGVRPSWVQLSAGARITAANGAGQVVLDPSTIIFDVSYPTSILNGYTGLDTSIFWPIPTYTQTSSNRAGGSAMVDLGLLGPGSKAVVNYTLTGTVQAYWVVDGDPSTRIAVDATKTYQGDTNGAHLVALQFQNVYGTPLDPRDTTTYAQYQGTVDNLSVEVDLAAAGVQPAAGILAQPVVPGYSRTQYGVVDVPGHGRGAVTMVTDPDGSAVAEVKDPEGRTIYKIVNPTTTYTTLFKDYLGAAFQPAAPKIRGTGSTATVDTNQKDLVTQYLFDSEGHLRVVLPPLGFTKLLASPGVLGTLDPGVSVDPTWGLSAPYGDQANRVIGADAAGTVTFTATNLAPYATYNAYDQSGHLVGSYNPDEGLTTFKVDQKGRVYFSQTARQRVSSKWTRTIYDRVYRVLAVGELATGATTVDPESILPVTSASDLSTQLGTLATATMSQNLYDAYAEDPLAAGSPLDAKVKALLPQSGLWQPFPDGHLTQTWDAQTKERYYYDQDGRILIRWVTLTDGAGAARHFAIGIYYDFAGRVKRLVYPSGPGGDPLQVVYTYDDLGRLFAVGTPGDPAYFARYAYQPTGEVRAVVYGPGEGFLAKRMLQDPQGWLRELAIQGK